MPKATGADMVMSVLQTMQMMLLDKEKCRICLCIGPILFFSIWSGAASFRNAASHGVNNKTAKQ